MLFASGIFASAPKVDTFPDNCYEKTLRVITDDDYVPYSYYDSKGQMSGHDIELITLIANEMHMNLDLAFKHWNDGIRDTVDGKADVLMTCDYSDSFEGTDKLLMSEPLTYDEFTVFSKNKIASTDELFGKRIAIMDNGNVLPHIGMLSLKDRCVLLKNNREALKALEKGEADCAIMRNTVGDALLKELGYDDIESYISIGPSYLCFGISNNNHALLERINTAIDTLRRNGQLDKLRKEWLTSFVHTLSFSELIANNLWIVVLFVLLIIAILLLLVANARSSAKAEEKTRREQMAKMAGGVSVYIVNPTTERFRIINQNEHLAANYTDDEDFNTSFSRYIKTDVYEPDRKRVSEKINVPAIVKALENGKEYVVRYRDISSGEPRWYEMRAVRLSDTEILYGFSDKDTEIIMQSIYKKLEDRFFALFYVDIDTGLLKTLKKSPWYDTGKVGEFIPYSPMMMSFASAFEEGETRNFFERISDTAYLKTRFAKEDNAVYIYKSPIIKGIKWASVTEYVLKRHEDGTPSALALGFSVLDEDATERQELQIQKNEDVQMISGLASRYNALYYININENILHIYTLDEAKYPGSKTIFESKETNFYKIIKDYGLSEQVHPDDRQLFKNFGPAWVREKLMGRKKFSMRFRVATGNGFRWDEMELTKYEDVDEEANAVAVGFTDRDAEIRSEQAINSSFDVLGQELPPDESIDRILSIAGEFYGADRCYVFEYAKNVGLINNTYEWCADGVEPMIEKLQKLPIEVVEGWNNEFDRQGAFHMDALDSEHNTKETVALLEMQGIKSLVAAPLMNGDEIVGFIGVDNPTKAKKDISILEKASSVVYSEILKRKENDEEHVTLGKLTDAFLSVYYTDLSTDYMRTWKMAEEYTEAYGAVQNYSVSMGGYVRENIAERDRERCIRMTSREYVLEQFKTQDRFSIDMTDIMLGYERNVVFDYIKVSKDGNQFVICCRDVTDTLKKEKEQQRLLQDALEKEITRARDEKAYQLAILNNAYSYFRINLSQNRIIPPIIEREHGQPVDYTGKFSVPLPPYESVIAAGAARYVDESYKESYKAYGNCAHLIRCFNEGDLMPEYTCYIYSTTIGWHYRKYVTYLSKDEISGDIYGMTVAYDVTKEYEAAEREKQYKLELEEARIAAEAANNSKTNFLFNMSHDIRTPMNAIKGFTTMAKKNAYDKEKVIGYLDKIDISGQQLLTLINQVLEMARIESGKVEFEEKPLNVRNEFNSMVTVLSEQARANGLEFIYSLGNIEHNNILADEARMSSITLNVTGNAIKYTPEGGRINYELKEIAGRKPGYATFVFTVYDTGIGMSKDYLRELYEPFSREKSSTVSKIQGTGLGLAIVKNTIDLMGGDIKVQSELGKGTRFEITVDFKIDENAEVETNENDNHETVSFAGRRVLLVEDNEMNREIAKDLLEEQGFIVDDANDGDVAVQKVKSQSEKGISEQYDFILMDIQMPRMNGYEAARAIRAWEVKSKSEKGISGDLSDSQPSTLNSQLPIRHIPIIAMTANAFEEDRQNALAAGMDEHLAKPIDVQKVFRTIAKFL